MRIRKLSYLSAERIDNRKNKQKGVMGAITLVNALFLLISLLCWAGTYLRNETLNGYSLMEFRFQGCNNVVALVRRDLEFNELNDAVNLLLENGTTVELQFGENSVKVVDAYRISTIDEQTEIILFVQSYVLNHGKELTRDLTDYIGEYRLHCKLYEWGYATAQTKDADLEYGKDPRWYVNLISRVIGLLGI